MAIFFVFFCPPPANDTRLAVLAARLRAYALGAIGIRFGIRVNDPAVVPDVNKHIVYARDKAGRVVARQLLCLSGGGKLVPLMVYTIAAGQTMQPHFAWENYNLFSIYSPG